MFRFILSCALCACLSAPCLGETVTFDFTTMDQVPDWFVLESGSLTDEGLWNFPVNPTFNSALAVSFRLDRPFSIDRMLFFGAGEGLDLGFAMHCNNRPRHLDRVDDYPIVGEYGCTSFNGRGLLTIDAGFYNDDDELPIPVVLFEMTVSLYDPVPVVLGDTDYDADVDLQDLNNVRNNFSQQPLYAFGDADHDGSINLSDLNAVRNNFGSSAPVPEPSSLALALILLITAPRIWRTRPLRLPCDSP